MNSFLLDNNRVDALLIRITASIKERTSQSNRKYRLPEAIPSVKHFTELIEVAFWGSLKKEEGEAISFHLCYCPPEHTEQSFFFGSQKPFSADQIAKLAPALNPNKLYIGIDSLNNESLQIWGFTPYPIVNCVHIHTVEPGQIVVTAGSLKTLITGERIVELKRDLPIPNYPEITQDVSDNSPLLERSLISKLAKKMRSHKKGGTLLIVPNNLNLFLIDSIDQKVNYNCGNYDVATEAIKKRRDYVKELRKKHSGAKFYSKILLDTEYRTLKELEEESFDLIAQLTAIDGATVINDNLSVLGFGAKIRAKDSDDVPHSIWFSEFFAGSDEVEKQVTDLLWGTRHKSAAQFVYDSKEAMAIVASQDGKISIMVWNNDKQKVSVITHAEYAFV